MNPEVSNILENDTKSEITLERTSSSVAIKTVLKELFSKHNAKGFL